MQSLGKAASKKCACTRPERARTVAVAAVKRARQYVARKELQKAAKQEYLKQFYESASRVEPDHLVYELKPSSPRLRAQQQQHAQLAEHNRQLAGQIPQLTSWQQLQDFLQQHSSSMNFLAVTALASQAAAVHQASGPPPQPDCGSVLPQLAGLLLQASSWFQPAHFAAAAAAMAACGVADEEFWDGLVAASEYKVGACSFGQLAEMLLALATVGFVPDLQWLERCHRQAGKHLHAAAAADICSVVWAWGEMGYTPRDRLFINQVKISTRRAFDRHELAAHHLVRLLHGLARMPRYAPNPGWLLALAQEVRQQMQQLTPGDVVDLLLSMAALGYQPPDKWLTAALTRLKDGFSGSSSGSSVISSGQVLLLPPLDMQQQFWASLGPAGITEPGLLAAGMAAVPGQQVAGVDLLADIPGPEDVEQLQDMFAAASAAAEADEPATAGGTGQQRAAAAAAGQTGLDAQQQQQQQQPLSGGNSMQQQQQWLSVEQLGVLCWCLGRLSWKPSPQWMQQLGRQLLLQCPSAPAEVVVDTLQGCVSLCYMPLGQLQHVLLVRAVQLVPSMQPEPLKRLCQALVALEQGLGEAAAAAGAGAAAAGIEDEQQQQRQQRRRSSGASSTAGGGSTAGAAAAAAALQQYQQQYKLPLAEAVAQRQRVVLRQSSMQQLADVFAYIAASGVKPSPEYLATGASRAAEKLAEGAPTASIVTLLWSLARLGFKPNPQLLHRLLAALQRGLHLLSSQDLADVGWALCTLKHRPGGAWLGLYMQQVVSKVGYMTEQALTDTLWALACFAAQPDREWLKRVLLAAGAVQLSSRNAAVVMWALQQLGFHPQAQGWGLQLQQDGSSSSVEHAVLGLVQRVLLQQEDGEQQQQQRLMAAPAG